jgi:AcrR family transcriptional regulator
MPRTKEQNEAIRAEKKRLILDAALELFAEDGYAHTSIERIAEHAGIAKGLIYSHFKSKDDLLHQILDAGVDKMSEGLFIDPLTPETFVESIDKMLDRIWEQKEFFKIYTALSVQPRVAQKLGPLADGNPSLRSVIKFYGQHFGADAFRELLLLSAVSKGFSVLALFGDRQKALPLDLLKEAVMGFVRQKFNVNNESYPNLTTDEKK